MAAAKLRCEELGERVVPALTYFAFDGGSGFFDYDDAAADAADPDQEVDMSDIGFTYGGSTYTGGDLVSGAIVKLEYGRPSGFVFEVVDVPNLAVQVRSGGYTVVTVDPHGTPSPTIPWPGTTIYGHGPPTLDTSGASTGTPISFTLSDGTFVFGDFAFATNNLVSTGSVDLTALNLHVPGVGSVELSDFDGMPTAEFSGGVFLGLTFSLTTVPSGMPFESLSAFGDGTVTATVDSAEQVKPVVFGIYPSTHFTLSDGQLGLIRYDIPSGDVDPGGATQSLPLSNFSLTLAGQTLTPSNATFTTSPTAEFEYGELVGITFEIDTSGITGYAYSTVSVEAFAVSAVDAGTAAVYTAALAPQGVVVIDFTPMHTVAGAVAPDTVTMTVTTATQSYTIQIVIQGPTNESAVALAAAAALKDNGFANATATGNSVTFTGPAPNGMPITGFTITHTNGNNQSDPTVIKSGF